MKTIGIIQSGYIPWRGYFDFINEVDAFVFLEDVQYTRRDWRSRNRVKTQNGSSWLTVPVSGGRDQLIKDVRIDYSQRWVNKHLDTIRHSYARAPFFEPLYSEICDILRGRVEHLSVLNRDIITHICGRLGITTPMFDSSELNVPGVREEKLIGIVEATDGTVYLSGPAAGAYLDPANWARAGIQLLFKDYSGYPEYDQVSAPFEPNVSIIDTLFMQGSNLQSILGPRSGISPVAE